MKTVVQVIQEVRQYDKTAIIWYDESMLRYSNEYFFGTLETTLGFLMWNVNNRTDPNEGDVGSLSLMNKLHIQSPCLR